MKLSRRDFVIGGILGSGTFLLRPSAWAGALPSPLGADPHFALIIMLKGGVDTSYLFDARPLSMTAAGKMQNYIGEEPSLWTGSNGISCLSTKLIKPLEAYRQDFSIINGIHMATGFDGHEQNLSFLFNGDPFTGESFVPHLNTGHSFPLDTLQLGTLHTASTNQSGTIPLNEASTQKLITKAKASPPIQPSDPLFSHMLGRMQANGVGAGKFSIGSKTMSQGLTQVPDLALRLAGVDLGAGQATDEEQFCSITCGFFKQGIARSGVLVIGDLFDTHDPKLAKGQPALYASAVNQIARIFKFLKNTPFDSDRSFLDVTTVGVTSEFGRTMRQGVLPPDKTGTDHNTLTNSVLLGGKGIRGGLVVGTTDFENESAALSPAHKLLDPSMEKLMGRPFDFATMTPRTDLPNTYDPMDYLNVASVVNTIYSLFGVESSKYRVIGRNGPPASILKGLLS
jgi:hypothetical protein